MNGNAMSGGRGDDAQVSAVRAAFDALPGTRTNTEIREWLNQNYPGLFQGRKVGNYLRGCAVNNPIAIKYHPNFPRFLYKKARGEFEPYRPEIHGEFSNQGYAKGTAPIEGEEDAIEELQDLVSEEVSRQLEDKSDLIVGVEAQLRDYLAKNLNKLESGLNLWETAPPSVELVIAGKRLDILAKDKDGCPVVIELKRDRAYDRVVGQALMYQALVAEHFLLERVRIVIVASTIERELRLAASRQADVKLFEYQLSMQLSEVTHVIQGDEGQTGVRHA